LGASGAGALGAGAFGAALCAQAVLANTPPPANKHPAIVRQKAPRRVTRMTISLRTVLRLVVVVY
jgi:hypothetical protein